MTIQVALSELLLGLDVQSDEANSYLNVKTGQVITVGFGLDWSEDAQEQVDPSNGDYLALPDRFELDEYSMMGNFAARSVHAEDLAAALRGSGAFRRFKDAVLELGVAKDWYAYREKAFERIAREWCAVHGIAVIED
jgi:hypothetical protein